MRRRGLVFLIILAFLISYTAVRISYLLIDQSLISLLVTVLIFSLIIGSQVVYRKELWPLRSLQFQMVEL